MCERSPLGLSHAQNRMSGRPQVAEILLMRSPQNPPTCGQKFGYTKNKSPESVGKISGSNISTPVAGGTAVRRQNARREAAGAPSTAGIIRQGYSPPEKADVSKASVRGGKTLTESKYSFLLEPYENGAPAPTLLQPEVPAATDL